MYKLIVVFILFLGLGVLLNISQELELQRTPEQAANAEGQEALKLRNINAQQLEKDKLKAEPWSRISSLDGFLRKVLAHGYFTIVFVLLFITGSTTFVYYKYQDKMQNE